MQAFIFTFLGADETPGPVKWIRPYFDCGRSNTWKYAAVVPIVDIYPRHTQFRHIEYPSYVAAAVMEIVNEVFDLVLVLFFSAQKVWEMMDQIDLKTLQSAKGRQQNVNPFMVTDFEGVDTNAG